MEKYQYGKNFLEKKEFLKILISDVMGLDNDFKIRKMLRGLCSYTGLDQMKYGRIKLTNEELILAQILKYNQISPTTA